MPRAYYKRYRMEFDLRGTPLPGDALPEGFRFQTWDEAWTDEHAMVKFRSLRDTVDAVVFRSLSEYTGCRSLMRLIASRGDFAPTATWLILSEQNDFLGPLPVGTIQGVTPSATVGTIQNVGVVPEFRGFGLGAALLGRSLRGFADLGLKRAALDVTARNEGALRLYERCGFTRARTSYRSVYTARKAAAKG